MKQQMTLHGFLTAPLPQELAEKMTYAQFLQMADDGRLSRAGTVRGPPLEIYAADDKAYHVFNFKANPSTTGFRHRGYVAFSKPRNGRPQPSENLPVEVDCDCEDYRYRWAWANHQRGAGPIGPKSLNKSINKAPVHTNPSGKPALCKHLLAARRYVLGLIQRFPKRGEETDVDVSWKIHQLVKKAQQRYDNYDQEKELAKKRSEIYRKGKIAMNIKGPMPRAEVPPNTNKEAPPPLPAEVPVPPAQAPKKPVTPPAAPVPKSASKPSRPGTKPKGGKENPNEHRVVKSTNSKNMNRNLLNESKAILTEMGDELETHGDVPANPEAEGPEAPPEFGNELPPPEVGEPGEMGAEGEPEDEALQLLRDIASGIARMADEVAPVAAEEGAEHLEGEEGLEPEEGAEGEDNERGEDEPGVPPAPDDDEDEFQETMPVSTGA